MPRLGRPALPPAEVRKALIGVRVREDERDLIRRAAEAEGKSTSDWAREILLREARRRAAGKATSAPESTKKGSPRRPK